ncbi:MAG TPA: hypothetical protein VM680_20260 [Verrucomicrobiae bacterium]|nr:hypothetical protein [Verrucomicrobiae bacterium]
METALVRSFMFNIKVVPIGLAFASVALHAQFAPLTLTPESYNQDIIVEKTALGFPAAATTASLDGGTNNTGFSYYEQGFNIDNPATGLPTAGSTFTSESLADHSYTMAADYTAPNAILINTNQIRSATYTLATPTALSGISFLAAGGSGAPTLTWTVTHADNSTETGTFIVPDWFGGANQALTANGRVNAVSRAFDNVNNNNPRLYSVDITLANTTSPVTKIDFAHNTGNGNAVIFAVSGLVGADFTPLPGAGFNYDVIVEAAAEQARNGLGATTATLDAGAANTDFTWYEQGYNKSAPLTGLPAPSQTVTNAAAPDHVYKLAPNYAVNNSILLDLAAAPVTVTPATPRTASGLSFLGSSGGGAVTISYTIHHADNTTQTGTFVVPDWFNATPIAYTVNGRVNAVNAGFSAVNSGNPRIYGVDIAVSNTGSPITSIDLAHSAGNGHAGILAISAAGGAVRPIFDLQPASTNVLQGGTAQFDTFVSGTGPFTYRWQIAANGNFVNVANGGVYSGATTTNFVITGATAANAADFRAIASNSAGSSTGAVVRLNVVSTKTDVTLPDDTITAVGGSSPGAEGVANAINNDTLKYLNFGLVDPGAPFLGPVGLEVTLQGGPAIVTGLRIYTANDVPERDPIDYKLEGSNDGTTFTTVSTGALSLPLARNEANLALDPLAQANQEISFSNSAGYSTYRLTFTNVREAAAADSVQIGEIELLGSAGAGAPSMSIARNADGTITITSSSLGTLQSTTSLNPPITWTDEGAINGSRTVSATGAMRFFRVVQ